MVAELVDTRPPPGSGPTRTDGIQCPDCGYGGSRVTDKRNTAWRIRRRRECGSCGAKYTTYEACASPREVGYCVWAPSSARMDGGPTGWERIPKR